MSVPIRISTLEKGFLSVFPPIETFHFQRLWGERRFSYRHEKSDVIDELSARLLISCLSANKALYLVLPDERERRPALLLTTALISLWLGKRSGEASWPKCLLYFGSTVGIREQLRDVVINDWKIDLAAAFHQRKANRHSLGFKQQNDLSDSLPTIITAYSPIDPIQIIKEALPDVVAIDSADSKGARWVQPIFEFCTKKRLPVLGWGCNPLSECADAFRADGSIFVWPPSAFYGNGPTHDGFYLDTPRPVSTTPILVTGQLVDAVSPLLKRCYGLLLRATKRQRGHFDHRAISLHWNYLRAIESMFVPVELYDAEAPRFWGLRKIESTREACEKFREACTDSELVSALDDCAALLDQALDLIREEPPLWTALLELCISKQDATRLVIAFSGRGRKQIFLFGLLARYNLTEDDLAQVNVKITTLDELKVDGSVSSQSTILVGMPSPNVAAKLMPFLQAPNNRILLWPHQNLTLTGRFERLGRLMRPCPVSTSRLLAELRAGSPSAKLHFPDLPVVLGVAGPQMLELKSSCKAIKPRAQREKSVIKENAAIIEVTKLFETDDDEQPSDHLLIRQSVAGTGGEQNADSDVCKNAIEVEFAEHYRIRFAPDDQVQLISSLEGTRTLEERFVSALRAGDRILYIQGQKRQNLYDLIVSRVHSHPAFQVHLALISRWQDDLQLAFRAHNPHLAAEDILTLLRKAESSISSALTVRNWINGETLCPDDPEDLRRIGDILGVTFIQKQFRHIFKAAQRIRGLHIGLALRLNGWLERAGVDADTDSEVFDPELGLTFGDFRNSLIVLTVKRIGRTEGIFLRSALGNLESL